MAGWMPGTSSPSVSLALVTKVPVLRGSSKDEEDDVTVDFDELYGVGGPDRGVYVGLEEL